MLEPGIYRDLPMREYLADPALSRSDLRRLHAQTPAHFRQYKDNPQPTTDAMIEGEALHLALLEPAKFRSEYAVFEGTRRGKKWDAFCEEHESRRILTTTQWSRVTAMADAARSKPHVARFLDAPGLTEVTVVWDDDDTGVRLKTRLDRLIDGRVAPVILDLKTTTDFRAFPFARAIDNYGYDMQGAMYVDAIAKVKPSAPDAVFLMIALEKDPPYVAQMYKLGARSLNVGRERYKAALRTYAECMKTGEWSDGSEALITIDLPDYILKQEVA